MENKEDKLIEYVEKDKEASIIITRDGVPVAILKSADTFTNN